MTSNEAAPTRLEVGASAPEEVNNSAPPHPTVLGISDIAAELGVRRETVDTWRFRGILPPPDYRIGGRPAWERSTILEWRALRSR